MSSTAADLLLFAAFVSGPAPTFDALPPPAAAVVVAAPAPAVTYRQAVGHTHTCAKGHTWDHTMDGGTHICPHPGCGLTQTWQDPFPRMVPSFPGQAATPAFQPSVVTYTIAPVQQRGGFLAGNREQRGGFLAAIRGDRCRGPGCRR